MRKSAALLLPLLLVLVLGAAGCGKGGSTGSNTGGGNAVTVDMPGTNFATASINVNQGGTVTYTDPSSGGLTHLLCLGRSQSCDGSIKDGPAELSNPSNPVIFNAGDSKKFTFNTKGDFPVTCTVHPGMNMVVHVV